MPPLTVTPAPGKTGPKPWMARSTRSASDALRKRTSTCMVACGGMTLLAMPPWINVTETDVPLGRSLSRCRVIAW